MINDIARKQGRLIRLKRKKLEKYYRHPFISFHKAPYRPFVYLFNSSSYKSLLFNSFMPTCASKSPFEIFKPLCCAFLLSIPLLSAFTPHFLLSTPFFQSRLLLQIFLSWTQDTSPFRAKSILSSYLLSPYYCFQSLYPYKLFNE